ncbi:MAG: hypothetical protein LQ350_006792 [Teloschistes chrysophthalmus]|nr:MAG: hypothetical protein LQ350_006792 [Niorma chrysophthalma]
MSTTPAHSFLTRIRYFLYRTFPHGWRGLWWQPITPYELRLSLRRLFHGSDRPLTLFFTLLQPYPWYFRVPKNQLTPKELEKMSQAVMTRQDGIFQLRCIPLFRMRDTPLCSIYRIYEYMCANIHDQVQYETEYFYYHGDDPRWAMENVPDPKDENEERYAFVASIVEALVASFNWRLSLGLQRDRSHRSFAEMDTNPPQRLCAPDWATAVPPLPHPLVIGGTTQRRKTPFEARNIVGAINGHMYTV